VRSTPTLLVVGVCYACDRGFGFNKEHPPVVDLDGVGQLVCSECTSAVNRLRVANGRRPILIHPAAYEPAETPHSVLSRIRISVGAGGNR
jgi:hypothetical protein